MEAERKKKEEEEKAKKEAEDRRIAEEERIKREEAERREREEFEKQKASYEKLCLSVIQQSLKSTFASAKEAQRLEAVRIQREN